MAQMMGFLPLRRDRPPKPDGGVVSLLLVVVEEFLLFHSGYVEMVVSHFVSESQI